MTTIDYGYGEGMNKWVRIQSEDELAPETGMYAIACKGDNHVLHEFHFMQKGERLFKYFEGEYGHSNGLLPVIPIAFHNVSEYSPQSENAGWYEFDINGRILMYSEDALGAFGCNFAVLALEEKAVPGKIYYAVLDLERYQVEDFSEGRKHFGWNSFFKKWRQEQRQDPFSWRSYFEKNSIIHTGNCFYDFLDWDCYLENYKKFHFEEVNILAYTYIVPCIYAY